MPTSLTDGQGAQISELAEIEKWLGSRGRNKKDENERSVVPPELRNHPAFRLLGKACRFRQYWLRGEDDHHAARVLGDPYWAAVSNTLRKHDLIREESKRQASGNASTFVHIKHKEWLLSEEATDLKLGQFYKDLAAEVGA